MSDRAIQSTTYNVDLFSAANRLAVWAGVGVFALLCWIYFGFTADDAYIVARYGRNLAELGLLQFNPGEPINALTSPLHGLIMGGLSLLTADPVRVFTLLAPVFYVLAGLHLVGNLPEQNRGVVAVTLLTSPFAALWAVGGLETPILMGLVALFCAALLRGSARASPWLLILAALMFLTRFDSILFTAPASLAVLWSNRARMPYWAALAGAVALAGGWLIFAQISYGTVLPTSYYLKGGVPADLRILLHIVYVISFVVLSAGAWMIGLLCTRKAPAFQTKWIRNGLFLMGLYLVTMASVHMMFSYRALIPYLPALIVIILGSRSFSRRWKMGIGGVTLAINLALGWTILTGTINPTIVNLYPARELESDDQLPPIRFEYTNVGITDYLKFTETLKEQAGALAAHWDSEETPSLLTVAAGISPWYLPNTHIMEQLVSYRPNCDFSVNGSVGALWRYADYIQLYQDSAGISYPFMPPGEQALIEQLPIVHEARFPFDMIMRSTDPDKPARFVLFYNPDPEPRPASLAKTFPEACRLD